MRAAECEDIWDAVVPGTVAATLLEHGVMPDPFWRDNEKKIQELLDRDYIFERSFTAGEDLLKQEQIVLHCNGLDLSLIHIYSIYIIDQKGTIISHNNKDMLSINFYNMDRFDQIFGDTDFQIIDKNKEKFLFSKCENSTLGWVMIEEIPLEVVLRPLASIQYIVIIFGFVVFLVIISLSYYLSSKIVKPLSNLCQQLEKVGSDEAPENFNVRGWAEINTISDECNYMLGRINMLVEDIKLKEESKRQVRCV